MLSDRQCGGSVGYTTDVLVAWVEGLRQEISVSGSAYPG
jgi:hypothetical protein